MAPTFLQFALAALIAAVATVNAETHTISFDNKCDNGIPTLVLGGQIVSNGSDYTFSRPTAGIAYLNTGPCLLNGENCALLEFNIGNPNPAAPGSGSSTDISLIAPHAFNVPTAFSYYNGCDGQGATCLTDDCKTAFFQPDDTWVQVACQTNDVNLLITFCPDGSTAAAPSSSKQVASPTPVAPSSSAAKPTTVVASTSAAAAATSAVPTAINIASSVPAKEPTTSVAVVPVNSAAPTTVLTSSTFVETSASVAEPSASVPASEPTTSAVAAPAPVKSSEPVAIPTHTASSGSQLGGKPSSGKTCKAHKNHRRSQSFH